MSTDIADQAKFEFERRRLELEERKQALEESWPKKYGAILFSSLFVFLGTVVTAGVTYKTTHDAQELTKQQRIAADKATMLQSIEAEKEQHIANARTALEMYFKNMDTMNPAKDGRAVNHMQLIAEISDNDGVRKVLEQMELDEIAREIARRMQMDPTDTKLVSGAAAGLPDLIKKTSGTAYAASDFVAYIQYPPGKQDLAQKLQAALGGLGMKTPGMEQVSSAPKADEIRLYKAAHAEFAQKLKSDLAGTTGLSFEPRVLGNSGQLPDGIMEFWIAK